jgi:hypothetical protein
VRALQVVAKIHPANELVLGVGLYRESIAAEIVDARNVDLHHRLVPPLVIKIGKDAKGHDCAPQQHAKQKIVAFPIQTIRHKPLRIEFAPQSMFYRRAGFPWRLWLRLTWIKEKDHSPA